MSAEEFKKLVNAPVDHPVAGRTLSLTPMKLRSSLRVQEIIEPFISDIAAGEFNVTRLAMRHAVKMFEMAVAILGESEREWLETLDDEEYETLLWKLVEVNQDFFARRVRAVALAELEKQLAGLSTRLGEQTPPSPSDPSP